MINATIQEIKFNFAKDVKVFRESGEMSDDLYDTLYEYYFLNGEMPYGVAKARDGDPMQWVADRFSEDI